MVAAVFKNLGFKVLPEPAEALNKLKQCPNIVVDDCNFDWIKEEVLLFVEENSRNLKLFKTEQCEVAVIQ